MKRLIVLFLVLGVAAICKGQSIYLKFDYRTSDQDDFINIDFLIKMPDSIEDIENVLNCLINDKLYLLGLVNNSNYRIYYNQEVAADIILNSIINKDSSFYMDSIPGKLKLSIIEKYRELEKMIDKMSYKDTSIYIPSGPKIKLGLVKLTCLDIKPIVFTHKSFKCAFFYLDSNGFIRSKFSPQDCSTNIVYFE